MLDRPWEFADEKKCVASSCITATTLVCKWCCHNKHPSCLSSSAPLFVCHLYEPVTPRSGSGCQVFAWGDLLLVPFPESLAIPSSPNMTTSCCLYCWNPQERLNDAWLVSWKPSPLNTQPLPQQNPARLRSAVIVQWDILVKDQSGFAKCTQCACVIGKNSLSIAEETGEIWMQQGGTEPSFSKVPTLST
jgi:hypothetical protein